MTYNDKLFKCSVVIIYLYIVICSFNYIFPA